jgi:hypothetical protein
MKKTKKIYLKFRKRTLGDAEFTQLTTLAGRIARLLYSEPPLKPSFQACLDDLLGAVYSLMYAKHYKFNNRPQPLSQKDIGNVLIRARKMSASKLRRDGKWTAGFYFNNALFRIAAVYHRSLKIVTGNEEKENIYVRQLEPIAKRFCEDRQYSWVNQSVAKVHDEVNNLKHSSRGIISGRNVEFKEAIMAVNEILSLIDALK